jgi:UDP-glucuronate 4-epimerase
MSLENGDELKKIFSQEHFDVIVNLAAQAGVRYSIENPYSYIQSNICGFFNILENCRNYEVPYLVFASSSSVYGLNSKVPYSEDDNIGTPVSLYAASKRSDELMAHAYSKLYGFTTVGLRYFTVYGPWGRPDMAPFKFTRSIINNLPIDVYNNGDMLRDFTYIDDIVHGTLQLIDKKPDIKNCENMVPFRVYNIGCSHPIRLMDFISEIEQTVGKPAQKIFKPMQPGDVYQTYADTTRIEQEIGYKPNTSLHDGIRKFVDWFRSDNNPLRDE